MSRAALLLLAALAGAATAEAASLNPITRVVEMMEDMVKKIQKDGKAEEDLFEGYVCWFKTVVSQKKAFNAQAADRIESLSAYIDDIKSGKVEFTSERKDLEEEIAKLNGEISEATAMRKKDNDDYTAAKDEMTKAIAALEQAVQVLGDATADAKEGVFTSIGFDLRRAVELSKTQLSADDLQLLQRALDGELQEEPDWKKLNRKAVFKMKYKARSGKIQEILADMLQTFKDNLDDAEKKEASDKKTSETLLEQKNSQLSAAQDALSSGAGEAAAQGAAVEEAQEEVDSLTAQVKADEGFIKQVEDSHATKLEEWKERKRLRSEEIASIEKAIEILSSDEARDIMSSSFKSQGNFLQTQEDAEKPFSHARVKNAVKHLHKVAEKTKDLRISALAMSMRYTAKGHFDQIVEGIDKLMEDLHKENDMDLKVKEDCENDRDKNTKIAKNAAYAIDTETSTIVRSKAGIDAKMAEIDRLLTDKKDTQVQRDEATKARSAEAKEYTEAKAQDEAAVMLIGKASEALKKFYDDNGLSLIRARQPVVTAGGAPPPPPTTWSEPYGGAKGESNGIQGIMSMVKADVEKDIKTADTEEKQAIADYEKFMADSKAAIEKIDADVATLEGEIGELEVAIKDARGERKSQKAVMEEGMMFLRSIAEGCDFMAANFELRKANREAETDGLIEAQAALTGGSFKL